MKRAVVTLGVFALGFVIGGNWGAYRVLSMELPEYLHRKGELEQAKREFRAEMDDA